MSSIIIGVTGLPSSGKGVFGEIAKGFGFKELVMGDVIRQECEARNLPINRETSNLVMIELRKERGENAVAVVTLEWIKEAINNGEEKILVDGIRSLAEVELFKQNFPQFVVIAIHASPKIRLERALNRKRLDDAFTQSSFKKRDEIELNVGIGDVIAKADILIDSSFTIEETTMKFKEIIDQIISDIKLMN